MKTPRQFADEEGQGVRWTYDAPAGANAGGPVNKDPPPSPFARRKVCAQQSSSGQAADRPPNVTSAGPLDPPTGSGTRRHVLRR
jgi:hypothetical protein